MPPLEITTMSETHIDTAAALLADRHARHREAEALLPTDVDFRALLERELARDDASGLVATRGTELVAYLVGRIARHAPLDWGFVDQAGCAATEPEVVRDLFARLAAAWCEAGVGSFAAMIPATDQILLDPWFRLAFGCQFMTAVRETGAADPVDAGVVIRAGSASDLEHVAAFDRILWALQAQSPSFSGLDVDAEDFLTEWGDTWDDPAATPHFVAERDGRVVGHALLYRRPTGDLRVPEDNIDLAHVATRDDVRGTGVGLALTAHVLDWAAAQGYRSMTTDWRSVNLLSSRFWPRRGFRPTFLRLYRSIP